VSSSAIILYSALFRSREAAFLLSLPARIERVFLHKFQEAILLSSWGFVLLGTPLLASYGLVARAPWYYFVLLLPLMVAFLYIPAAVGAVACLLLVHWLPSRRHAIVALLGVTALVAAGGFAWSLVAIPESNILTASWLYDMLARLRFTEHRLMPGWWLSSGLLEAARGQWSESVMFLVLLISNALVCREVAVWTAGRIYRSAYSTLSSGPAGRKRARAGWVVAAGASAAGQGLPRLPP